MKQKVMLVVCVILSCGALAFSQLSKPVEIDNDLLRISIDKNSKTWSLFEFQASQWRPVIVGAATSLTFEGMDSVTLINQPGEIVIKTEKYSNIIGNGKKLTARLASPTIEWNLDFVLYDSKKIVTLSGSLKNLSGEEWKPNDFHLVDISAGGFFGFNTNNVLMHVNGYQSWSNSEIVKLDSVNRYTSYWSTVFNEPEAYSSVMFGFLTNGVSRNSIEAEPLETGSNQTRLLSHSDIKNIGVAPGGELHSDTLLVSFDSSPTQNLQRFGEYLQAFGPTMNKPFTPTGKEPMKNMSTRDVPTGWCSWYYYYQNITEDSILVNVNAAARNFLKAGLQYIQIDDGFQLAAGDWNTNKKFPHGHRWLVDRIHQKGFLAGLWVAPFAVSESSTVYKHHRDWLLRDAGDTLKEFFANDWWGGRIFSLDPTNPDVQWWLTNLFSKITHEWGYDYVKIDFLYFAAEGGKYSQPVSSARAYQMGLQAIRRGVGPDKFVLGCGAPIGSSIGYVDGMRVGSDVYAGWGGVLPGVNATAERYFYDRSVWYNDPDCLVVRDPLTLDQARAWASVVALSGGVNMLSDKLPALPADRVDLLKMTIPSYGQPATPVDLFTPPKNLGLTLRSANGISSLRLPEQWKFSVGDTMAWKEPLFDDGTWKEIPVPSHWENVGYPGVDGFVWYRVKFRMPDNWPRGPVTFSFGKIDDCDETYCNGTLVGRTGTFPPSYSSEWTTYRDYTIPEELIRWDRENTLAVRVYDGDGPGGIYSTKQLTLPAIWNLGVEKPFEKWNVVGLFNWTGEQVSLPLRLSDLGLSSKKKYLAFELWSEKYLGEVTNEITIALPATSSKVVTLHEMQNHPMILSTSRHIVQGAIDLSSVEWDSKKMSLSVVSDKLVDGPYSVYIHVPPGMEVKNVIAPIKSEIKKIADSVVCVNFTIVTRDRLAWKVAFQ